MNFTQFLNQYGLCEICKRDFKSCPHTRAECETKAVENWIRGIVRDEINSQERKA